MMFTTCNSFCCRVCLLVEIAACCGRDRRVSRSAMRYSSRSMRTQKCAPGRHRHWRVAFWTNGRSCTANLLMFFLGERDRSLKVRGSNQDYLLRQLVSQSMPHHFVTRSSCSDTEWRLKAFLWPATRLLREDNNRWLLFFFFFFLHRVLQVCPFCDTWPKRDKMSFALKCNTWAISL